MKKLLSIAAALLIGAFCFAETVADGGAAPAAAGSVSSIWEFKGTPKKSKIGEDYFSFSKPVTIAAVEGSKGADFSLLSGETKWKTENGITALYHNNKSSATLETLAKTAKAKYTVTLEDAANLVITVCGNGGKEPSRCAALVNEAGETIVAENNLESGKNVALTFNNAPKGVYTLLVNGSRIIKVEANN